LLLDLQDKLTLGVCCEIDVVPLLNALNLYHYFHDRLNGRMYVRNHAADSFEYARNFSIVAFVHMLLYVRRDLLPEVLKRAWDALEPDGILLVFENTVPPSSMDGVDSEIIFTVDELENYMSHFGEIEYALPGTGQEVTQDMGLKKPLVRYVRKRH